MTMRRGYRLRDVLQSCRQTLRETRRRLAADAAAGRRVPPAGEWILDHYTFLADQVREIREAMPARTWRLLPRAGAKAAAGEPRSFLVAAILAHYCRGEVPVDQMRAYLESFQQETPLTMAELWLLRPMLKLVLLERVCGAITLLDRPDAEEQVRSAVLSLKALEVASWPDLVEAVSPLDRVLRQDPAGVYARSDFRTRDACRHEIEKVARRTAHSEVELGELALDLAREAAAAQGLAARAAHVGYFLVGAGKPDFEWEAGYRRTWRETLLGAAYRRPNLFYLGGLAALTLGVTAAVERLAVPAPWWYLAALALVASQAALMVVNRVVTLWFPARRLPRLDFREGIPDDCRTFVVVPTLLLSRGNVTRLLERLEIHYLANRDSNLAFALLTDERDSASPEGDPALVAACAEGIRALNRRYGAGGRAPFYLFHRPLLWNPQERVWMGHERKRGKLNDFNALLVGEADRFSVKVGDLSVLKEIRYVLTLDSDTQLPRDAARELVATIAHPLNRAVLDPATGMVQEGYALLQPRVSISMESASRSRIARFYSGQTGFDPYTTAVSDVYQDLYGRASFTGKGIYDVRAFHAAADGRFPENRILSHDLIEGEHARVGLVTDVEVIDDFPSTYQSYTKRKHRWVRGDWQIARWLAPRVPAARGAATNHLDLLSRWKIADNLRRSLYEIALPVMLVGGCCALPGGPPRALEIALAVLLAPAYLDLLLALVRVPPVRFWRIYIREVAYRFGQAHVDVFYNLVLALHQSLVMLDAIGRTLARLLVFRRKLLEWETMAQAEGKAGRRTGWVELYLFLSPVAAVVSAECIQHLAGGVDGAALAIVELWILAPLLMVWLNGAPMGPGRRERSEIDFLRRMALGTWRYFVDHATQETHGLVPDNVQEDPPAAAHRTSPTNLGLQVAAQFAAHDFGYLTHQELAERLRGLLAAMERLPRLRGHFYNWHDTRTGMPLAPHFVSTVDSGNLAACLLVAKQGNLGLQDHALIDATLLAGLRDHCLHLREALPGPARTSGLMRLLTAVLTQLEDEPTDLFHWEGLLSGTAALVRRLKEPLERRGTEETAYWYGLLAARLERALADLRALAPWLGEPFEPVLRIWSNDRRTAGLIHEMCRVPRLAQLRDQYEAIGQAAAAVLQSPEPLPESLRRVLAELPAALEAAAATAAGLLRDLHVQAESFGFYLESMDFSFLFDAKRKLLRIGYDAAARQPAPSYYDLLGSEARTAVFVAIAKGDLPRDAWFSLGRKLTAYRGQRTLVSWSGTMFEYLMPALFMKRYGETLVDLSLDGVVRIQQQYCRERRVPWGISEAAYAVRDHQSVYQYKAFGLPIVAADAKCTDDLVVAPYATMLAAMVDLPGAAANLRRMAAMGWTGRYGFYEAADYTRRPGVTQPPPVLIRAHMAHHQGMALLALANALGSGAIQERFHADPMVLAAEFLLQERAPSLVPIAEPEQPAAEPVVADYPEVAEETAP